MRVISIDPALRNTGYAVIDQSESKYRAVTYGVIKNKKDLSQSQCLVAVKEQLQDVIKKYQPECCAIESIIYVQSYKTAITLGAARAAGLIAAGEHGLPIYEYAPRKVKQAVVGKGAAAKEQVAFMVRALLELEETPSADAADALAIGLAHFYAEESNQKGIQKSVQV